MTFHVQAHAVVTAVDVQRDAEEVQHLRKGERDHDEVDAARAHGDGSGHECYERRGNDGDAPLEPTVVHAIEREDTDGVAADPKVGGVAEGH